MAKLYGYTVSPRVKVESEEGYTYSVKLFRDGVEMGVYKRCYDGDQAHFFFKDPDCENQIRLHYYLIFQTVESNVSKLESFSEYSMGACKVTSAAISLVHLLESLNVLQVEFNNLKDDLYEPDSCMVLYNVGENPLETVLTAPIMKVGSIITNSEELDNELNYLLSGSVDDYVIDGEEKGDKLVWVFVVPDDFPWEFDLVSFSRTHI